MRLIILAIAIVVLSGCADKMHLSCPNCTLTNDKFVCVNCEMEADAVRFNGDILEILPPIIKPMRNPPPH